MHDEEKPKASVFAKRTTSDPNQSRRKESSNSNPDRRTRHRSLFRRRTGHSRGGGGSTNTPISLEKEVEEEKNVLARASSESLFESGMHGNLIPSYSDRVMWLSRPAYEHLLQPLSGGTCEGIRSSTHVPVFAHFSVVGKDASLLTSWQRLSGNLPMRLASRVTEHMKDHVADTADTADIDQDQHAMTIHLPRKSKRVV